MPSSKRARLLASRFVLFAALLFSLGAAADDSDPRASVQALIGRANLLQLARPDFSRYRPALDAFYKPGGYAPQWFGANNPWREALTVLAAAPTHGLDPADYDLDWLRAEFEAIAAGDHASERAPRADVALTVSLFRLLTELHRGRVTAESAGFHFKSNETPLDIAALLRSGLFTGNLHDAVAAAQPSFPLYLRLEEALAHYRGLATEPLPAVPPLPKGVRKIEPGGTYRGVAAIAERLRRVGDLPADAGVPTDNRYQGAIVDAVRSYQERHGLKADGVLGRDTLASLATPFAARVRQLELSLERMRWLPQLPPGPVIAVNIPSFRLWAFTNARRDHVAALTMPVIVGGAVTAKKTPVFIGEMKYVEFSPYWNVPPTIQKNEIVPKLQRDPGYWGREDFEAVPIRGGSAITALDSSTLDGLARGSLRVRQRPGPKNALGAVKFVLPNTMDIYLHGTPAQQLFERTRRDFSHGCIRVADPPALTLFVLADQPEWTPERIADAMQAENTSTVRLARSIPVIIFYTTAIVDAKDRVLFQTDIYGYDAKLEKALKER